MIILEFVVYSVIVTLAECIFSPVSYQLKDLQRVQHLNVGVALVKQIICHVLRLAETRTSHT